MVARYVAMFALAAVFAIGCASALRSDPNAFHPTYTLHVANHRWTAETIYQGCNGSWYRAGEVEANDSASYTVAVCMENKAAARMFGTNLWEESDPVLLNAGDTVTYELDEHMPPVASVRAAL